MKKRKVVRLSPRLEGELESYVAAAKAESQSHQLLTVAGVIGLTGLSLVPALSAEIVYTPANRSVGCVEYGFSTMKIDLNNDGVADFFVGAYNFASFSSHVLFVNDVWAQGLGENQIMTTSGLAAAKAQGQIIGAAGAQFSPEADMANALESTYRMSSGGLWLNATNRYLGVRFTIYGEIHYGWARFNAGAGCAKLTGYAYETIPNKPIPAGVFEIPPPESNAAPQEPATLGALAMGARRRNPSGK